MNATQIGGDSAPSFGVQREQNASLVLLSGLATTALALLGIYVLDQTTDDFHIMGWYANYVLPVGAILVGLVASSGYGLASWFTGIKITRKLLWIVLGLQCFAYFGAQYIEFSNLHLVHGDTNKPVGFFEYFDWAARSFAWQESDGKMGEPLGAWGYCFRGLELVGFAAGSLIVPLVLLKAPYCAECQRYMRKRQLSLVPASVPVKKLKKSDLAGRAAHEAEQQQAADNGKQTVAKLGELAQGGNAADFRKALEELAPGKKKAAGLPARFDVRLIHCQRCHHGRLRIQYLLGQGNAIKATDFSKTELHPEFVRSVLP